MLDTEFTTPAKGYTNLITGGRRLWYDANLRLIDLSNGKTVPGHSLSCTKPKADGLDVADFALCKTRIMEYTAAGYTIYNFSKGADSRFITYCAGLQGPEAYGRVAVDFRALLDALTTFFSDTGAPNSMDLARDMMGLPGTTEWILQGEQGAGVPHTASMDTWQMAFEVCALHKLLADRSLPIARLLAAP